MRYYYEFVGTDSFEWDFDFEDFLKVVKPKNKQVRLRDIDRYAEYIARKKVSHAVNEEALINVKNDVLDTCRLRLLLKGFEEVLD